MKTLARLCLILLFPLVAVLVALWLALCFLLIPVFYILGVDWNAFTLLDQYANLIEKYSDKEEEE